MRWRSSLKDLISRQVSGQFVARAVTGRRVWPEPVISCPEASA